MGGGRSCRCVKAAGLCEEWPRGSPRLEPAAVFSLEEFLGADWLGGAPITPASLCAKILGCDGENTVEPRSVLETFLRDTAAQCWMVFLSLTASEGFLRLKSSLGSGCSPVLGVALCILPLGAQVRSSLGVGEGSASLWPHTGQSWEQQEALQQRPARARVCSMRSAPSRVLKVPALAAPLLPLTSGQGRNHRGQMSLCRTGAGVAPPRWGVRGHLHGGGRERTS